MNILDDLDYLGMIEPFGVDVLCTLENGSQFSFRAIFDNTKDIYDSGIKVASTTPKVTCRTVDTQAVTQKCTLSINSTKYRIRTVLPDGYGITEMELYK